MRILMIIDGLSGGGAEKTVLTLSRGLSEMGHHVSIFSLREKCDYLIPQGIDFRIIRDQNKTTPFYKINEISRRAKLLDKAIINSEYSGKYNIIFSHLHKTDRIVAHSRILNREKVWFCIHSLFSFSYLKHRHGIFRWLKLLKIRHTYKNRNVIAVSSGVLFDISEILKIPLCRSVIIHNPFDINDIQKKSKEHFEMQGQDYIIHVGRFHEHKRHDRLLRAYAISKINIPLVMMGSGKNKKILQLQELARKLGIREKVFFRDFMQNPYPWIKGARLVVSSSDFEGFCNVLVEAIICQTPVVSTQCPGGPREILTGELTRGFSELSDESLAQTLVDIYRNPPVIDTTIIFSSYKVQTICKQYLSLIKLS